MPPVIALLGPTNTGKTFHAVERLLAHRTGMIGFPLRLLARENYDRLVQLRGEAAVALVTGEERIVPAGASYFVCTVEAMPLDRRVDFLAVDEVQLAADRERGHIFTDRILHARGLQETMLLGAETVRPLLRRMVPEAGFITRERLSVLSYSGYRKLAALPRRSAIVGFSVAGVYEIADRVRRETGGAAVVFGALSPRTRNAQVGLYQAGEVDYLVATDAIGMGLNLDIEHVAFTNLVKFDGLGPRALRPAEIGQIAGRAGRYLRDGTFGPTLDLEPFDERLAEVVENHRFDPLDNLFWRNSDLEYRSLRTLLDGLDRRSPAPYLVRAPQADDQRALEALAADPEIRDLASSPEEVRLLWDVCQVPDFRNVMSDAHTRLLAQIFRYLRSPARRLPEDWVAGQVAALDRVDGDIDALLARIAHIRTWTYVSHRGAWLSDAAHWQARTRAVEDHLSDALHARLTEQFVDRGAAVLSRVDPDELVVEVAADGEVDIQGVRAGRLAGFRFVPDAGLREDSRLRAAANRVLRTDIGERVRAFVEEADAAFSLDAEGQVSWRGSVVGRLVRGDEPLRPRVEPAPSDLLDPALRERVRRRLAEWVDTRVGIAFAPLLRAETEAPAGPVRGIVFALRSGLGLAARRDVASQIAHLAPEERRALGRLGISLGRRAVFLSNLYAPEVVAMRGLLWAVHQRAGAVPVLRGEASLALDVRLPAGFYAACGYVAAGPRAVRADRLERLAAALRKAAREGRPLSRSAAAAMIGAPVAEIEGVATALGFTRVGESGWREKDTRGPRGPVRRAG